jgi:hypothetical protein
MQAIWIFVNEPQLATTKKGAHRLKFEIECDARMHGEIHMALAKIVELYIPTVATFRLAWCRRAVTILRVQVYNLKSPTKRRRQGEREEDDRRGTHDGQWVTSHRTSNYGLICHVP